MQIDKTDFYKAAALSGLLAGITIEPKSAKDEVTDEDLMYLELLCTRIANVMVRG